MSRLDELAQRRQALVDRIEAQRQALAHDLEPWQGVARWTESGSAWLRQWTRPGLRIVLPLMVTLLWRKPRLRTWMRRGLLAWELLRDLPRRTTPRQGR